MSINAKRFNKNPSSVFLLFLVGERRNHSVPRRFFDQRKPGLMPCPEFCNMFGADSLLGFPTLLQIVAFDKGSLLRR
ncbi:hypothetical protein AUF78_15435 [archaeon 13_1_20CM_2_51_12]|nr:MAG: hypothetical protein AUF78_15435 [archaeon 13_1_20CM_2_51_12]